MSAAATVLVSASGGISSASGPRCSATAVNSVLEIVLDGIVAATIGNAMRAGIDAACTTGVRAISAGNYGGKLGPHHFHLRELMNGGSPREQ
jgi:formylmethanofuran:tetrahydromethanopterin formyltransferase